MNGFCRDTPASNACYGCTVATDDICPAHNPEPDEAAESARTSGSPTGSRSDSCGTTEVQLAPVLRPCFGADPREHDLKVEAIAEDVLTTRCIKCHETFTFRRAV